MSVSFNHKERETQRTFPFNVCHTDWIGILIEDQCKCDEEVVQHEALDSVSNKSRSMFWRDLLLHEAGMAVSQPHT
jgi:hypothetical protein